MLALGAACAHARGWHVTLPGGQMRFQGQLYADACEVALGDRSLTVTMGTVSSNRFMRDGDDADPIPFDIHLMNCNTNVSHRVAIQFRGVADGKNPDVLSVGEGPGIATNVGVALFDDQGNFIPLNGMLPQAWQKIQAGPMIFHLLAKYRATGREVTGGAANAQAWFYLTYE
ncbi:fimbrial protein [Pantoea ananatis]|uniref:fimbrial protein n=1 Tax=Pantoea ananas TaxID=553 RepID=UPI0024AD2046|nr:fimbrial protein [Pantoea ananatis]MDI6539108.1 fimbrial protein [Pantoea ananatis]